MTRRYFAYLLRLWQTDDPENPTWRASVEDPHTRQVTGFNSLEALWTYVLELVAKAPGPSPTSSGSDDVKRE
jgi:hypothetical protein